MPRPRTLRTQAIILKRRDFGEADRLVMLLTPDHGKVDAIAKGARKPGSKKTGHIELFTRADVLLSRGRDLFILTQAEMVEPFLRLREDLTLGAYAGYAVELLDRFTSDDEDEMKRLFILLNATLKSLCEDDDPRLVIRYFEMHLLDAAGFRPELSECVVTREMILPEDQFFSFEGGGVISPEGASLTGDCIPISMNALKLLRHLQRSKYYQVKKLKLTDAIHQEVERVMLGYITYLLERQLQSVAFIRRVRQLPALPSDE